MLVETDSEAEADANSETCVREVDSETLFEIGSEFKTDSDTLADALVDVETETLIDSEVNSDTEAD